MGNIVTLTELASYLKLRKSTVQRFALYGKLPGFKIGNSWRFNMDEILMLLQGKKSEKANRPNSGDQ